jgi:hypothetical protein
MKFRHQNVVWYYRRDLRYRCPNVGLEEFNRDSVSEKKLHNMKCGICIVTLNI